MVFTQFTKEIVGEQQRINLSQQSVLTNGPENRQPQKQRGAPEGIQQICLTQTGDLAVYLPPAKWEPARVPGLPVLWHPFLSFPCFTHPGHKNFGFEVIRKANIFYYFRRRKVILLFFLMPCMKAYRQNSTTPRSAQWTCCDARQMGSEL